MPAPINVVTTSAILSSTAEMILDHIEEAPSTGMMDGLEALAAALNACATDHGGSTDAPIRLTLATMLRND